MTLDRTPLRHALEALSERMGFVLSYSAGRNPLLSGHFQGEAHRVVRDLVGDESLVMTVERDPLCAAVPWVSRVVVLPLGDDAPLPDRTTVPEGLQRYRRAHGMDPLTGEPLARPSPNP